MSVRRRWRVPMLGARELVDVPDELGRRVEQLLADGGQVAARRRAEQEVSTLVELFGYRRALARAEHGRRAADDGLLAASVERHCEVERIAGALCVQLELHAGLDRWGRARGSIACSSA